MVVSITTNSIDITEPFIDQLIGHGLEGQTIVAFLRESDPESKFFRVSQQPQAENAKKKLAGYFCPSAGPGKTANTRRDAYRAFHPKIL